MQGNMPPEERIQITYDLATNESRLRIEGLEYGDAGTYYCSAMINGVSKSVGMTLRVVGKLGNCIRFDCIFGLADEIL